MPQISEKRLYNITVHYLTKYDASSQKIRQMLKRRLYKMQQEDVEIPEESEIWIENVIQKMQNLGYLNDERFAQNQVRILSQQGKSASFITNKLKQAGVSPTATKSLLEEEEGDDLSRAKIWLKHHKKGHYRLKPAADKKTAIDFYTKDLSALGRAGFSYETAVQALKNNIAETDEIDTDFE